MVGGRFVLTAVGRRVVVDVNRAGDALVVVVELAADVVLPGGELGYVFGAAGGGARKMPPRAVRGEIGDFRRALLHLLRQIDRVLGAAVFRQRGHRGRGELSLLAELVFLFRRLDEDGQAFGVVFDRARALFLELRDGLAGLLQRAVGVERGLLCGRRRFCGRRRRLRILVGIGGVAPVAYDLDVKDGQCEKQHSCRENEEVEGAAGLGGLLLPLRRALIKPRIVRRRAHLPDHRPFRSPA